MNVGQLIITDYWMIIYSWTCPHGLSWPDHDGYEFFENYLKKTYK